MGQDSSFPTAAGDFSVDTSTGTPTPPPPHDRSSQLEGGAQRNATMRQKGMEEDSATEGVGGGAAGGAEQGSQSVGAARETGRAGADEEMRREDDGGEGAEEGAAEDSDEAMDVESIVESVQAIVVDDRGLSLPTSHASTSAEPLRPLPSPFQYDFTPSLSPPAEPHQTIWPEIVNGIEIKNLASSLMDQFGRERRGRKVEFVLQRTGSDNRASPTTVAPRASTSTLTSILYRAKRGNAYLWAAEEDQLLLQIARTARELSTSVQWGKAARTLQERYPMGSGQPVRTPQGCRQRLRRLQASSSESKRSVVPDAYVDESDPESTSESNSEDDWKPRHSKKRQRRHSPSPPSSRAHSPSSDYDPDWLATHSLLTGQLLRRAMEWTPEDVDELLDAVDDACGLVEGGCRMSELGMSTWEEIGRGLRPQRTGLSCRAKARTVRGGAEGGEQEQEESKVERKMDQPASIPLPSATSGPSTSRSTDRRIIRAPAPKIAAQDLVSIHQQPFSATDDAEMLRLNDMYRSGQYKGISRMLNPPRHKDDVEQRLKTLLLAQAESDVEAEPISAQTPIVALEDHGFDDDEASDDHKPHALSPVSASPAPRRYYEESPGLAQASSSGGRATSARQSSEAASADATPPPAIPRVRQGVGYAWLTEEDETLNKHIQSAGSHSRAWELAAQELAIKVPMPPGSAPRSALSCNTRRRTLTQGSKARRSASKEMSATPMDLEPSPTPTKLSFDFAPAASPSSNIAYGSARSFGSPSTATNTDQTARTSTVALPSTQTAQQPLRADRAPHPLPPPQPQPWLAPSARATTTTPNYEERPISSNHEPRFQTHASQFHFPAVLPPRRPLPQPRAAAPPARPLFERQDRAVVDDNERCDCAVPSPKLQGTLEEVLEMFKKMEAPRTKIL